jgi:hypothetical protein
MAIRVAIEGVTDPVLLAVCRIRLRHPTRGGDSPVRLVNIVYDKGDDESTGYYLITTFTDAEKSRG